MKTAEFTDGTDPILNGLRTLYASRGYTHYKMNKFEEYDLYAGNKDFLISDSVITFTDGTGKLLALKPDVTLSIVKNTPDTVNGTKKLWYNENVYRVAKGSRSFREIMQVGLECIGSVDGVCVREVLSLALNSLKTVGGACVLSVSHLGILNELMDSLGIPDAERPALLGLIGEKNLHELGSALDRLGVGKEKADLLLSLPVLRGSTEEILASLNEALHGLVSKGTLSEFTSVLGGLAGEKEIVIDFTVVSDLHYYSGFVFKGYVEGIPASVLSGGQYDRLMRKMGKRAGAIGFAVYLDLIGQYQKSTTAFDADVLLLYDASSSAAAVCAEADRLVADGKSVRTASVVPEGLSFRETVTMREGKVI
ncbi:MAG: ATP phosphoribosyltransferase regulatory subunit [Lachnospiraceae bacterium]|nr:ATP phosphoribosyltransferase regulatory subunit [Lachnospiraceae bacterium]